MIGRAAGSLLLCALQINSFKSPIGTADIPAVDFNPLQLVDFNPTNYKFLVYCLELELDSITISMKVVLYKTKNPKIVDTS